MVKQPKDIYELLMSAEKIKKRKDRLALLHAVGINDEYFEAGTIKIDTSICKGAECKLCIKACPTNALYWNEGQVRLEKDLCIYCGACVLNCMIENCISITRRRKDGNIERLSTPRDVTLLMDCRMVQRRSEIVKSILVKMAKASLGDD